MALGARRGAVLGLVVGYHMRRVGMGIAIGLVIAAAATRAIANLIYGVSPLDGWTYAFTAGLLAAVCLGAAYIPARRAVHINPVDAIRTE
jgi:ABC-type antimicrobial peptide transport system permease subunit